jgi:hypothetical protein
MQTAPHGTQTPPNDTHKRIETDPDVRYWNVMERDFRFRGLQVVEMWWPGRELNPRRQPFQGCALPLSYLAV